MSGHSHFATIKRKKEVTDKKRGKIFSKLSKMVSLAAKEGSDPSMNPRLRMAIEEAKSLNMPKDNIERAIKKGSGELEGEKLEEVLFEIIGPEKTAIIASGITDNKNRTAGEVRKITNDRNCKLANEGSVLWMFDKMGQIIISVSEQEKPLNKDELELSAIEAGAQDFIIENDYFSIITKVENLEKVKKEIQEKGIKIDSAALAWIVKEKIEVNEKTLEACQKLFEALDDNDDIQEIYSNIKE